VANVTIVCDHFPFPAEVLTVMASETANGIHVSGIVRVSSPIGLHFRKHIRLIDSLNLSDRISDRLQSLLIKISILRPIKTIEILINCGHRLLGRIVVCAKHLDRLPFQVR
jgi:hypothetical protein